ncbi:hypothetical protein SAMN04488082_11396 [Desulfomicrobium apsheronum]|uniref:FecR family protein n=1 Tax=Desulfomicrobium apsheronum TaxID=52560 RepID=A0A1I3WK86_9BACT|nr:hypothetical protein [Desulfomicrobium apsheronum]SFK07948.1 hypothetical protein SAMN04488082_11396 [Desulfomicrobium apsheronum]
MLTNKTIIQLFLVMLLSQPLLAGNFPEESVKLTNGGIIARDNSSFYAKTSTDGVAPSATITPMGSIELLESNIVVDKEIPAPKGMFMACQDQVYVEAKGLQLLCSDKTVFAIIEESSHFSIMIEKGNVDFALQANSKPIEFKTPFDTIRAKPYLIPASSNSLLRGSLHVSEEKALLTITQGSLEIMSASGRKLIHAGNAIVLAQATTSTGDTQEPSGTTGATGTGTASIGTNLVVGLTTLTALSAGALIIANNNDDGDSGESSPF